jgi:hypothetical protein
MLLHKEHGEMNMARVSAKFTHWPKKERGCGRGKKVLTCGVLTSEREESDGLA